MIKINELRVGNLIQNGRVEQIDNSLDEVYYSSDRCYLSDFCCNLTPIPLTEEYLNIFGFESDGIEWWDGVICLGIYKDGIYYMPTEEIGYRIGNELKYVHQLQNLYFALTGSELQYVA